MTLGLQAPWDEREVLFAEQESGQKKLHLHIGFARGSRFTDETGAAGLSHSNVIPRICQRSRLVEIIVHIQWLMLMYCKLHPNQVYSRLLDGRNGLCFRDEFDGQPERFGRPARTE